MWRIFFFLSINRTEKLKLNLAYLSRREETNYKFSLHYIRAKKNFQKILRREKEKERGEKKQRASVLSGAYTSYAWTWVPGLLPSTEAGENGARWAVAAERAVAGWSTRSGNATIRSPPTKGNIALGRGRNWPFATPM